MTPPRIAIIDYGRGNLRSVQKGFGKVGYEARVTRDPDVIADATHVVLPGVGAFADCMANLEDFGLIGPIHSTVESGKPFLGICVGMQLLFTEGEEFGTHKGLDILPGRVVAFPQGMTVGEGEHVERLKVPHMGWNRLHVTRQSPLFRDIHEGEWCYFVHSYHAVPEDLSVVAATSQYGVLFTASVWNDNVVATQFHPEKSDKAGLSMLKAFAEWQC
ncbi:MAG: imidazole glycerol phosphate synthase subunit HisH [Nitrospirota bacterium]|nr:imidazole glycerol phosphate synthase subunit HisH [Nitrospirota bacterium]